MNALTGPQSQPFYGSPMPTPQPQPQSFQPPAPMPMPNTFGQNQQSMFQQAQTPMQSPNVQPIIQPQPTSQPTGFVGRYINTIDEVVLNEVPMDGNVAIFPTRDAQAIYLKVWNQNGSLLTARYVLDPVQPDQQTPAATPMDDILDRLNRLEDAIAKRQPKKTKDANKE